MAATVGSTADGPQPSRPPWWMLVLAALFVGYYVLLLHSDLTRPEESGFAVAVDESEIVVRRVAPGSPAARAGLAVGDRIAIANAHPIRTRLDWLSVEMNLTSGQPLRLDIARAGVRQSVAVVMNRAPVRYWATTAGVTLLSVRGVQLITLTLAIVVAFRRPVDLTARLGVWVLATLAVYSIVWPYQIAATWRGLPVIVSVALWIPFVSSLSIAAILFTFFASFPRPMLRSPLVWAAVWAPMTLVIFFQVQFTSSVVYHPEQISRTVDWTPLSAAVTAAYAIGAMTVLLIGYQRLTDLNERRRVRVFVGGSAVGLLGALPVVVPYWWQSEVALESSIFASPAVAAGSMLALALPLSFAYAILRHRLFDVRLIIRLGLQYALARRVLVSIVPAAGAAFLLDLWLHREIPFADNLRARGWMYLGLAGVAVVARARRSQWLDGLDRRFFRERLNAQRLLRGIGDELRLATDLDAVAPRVVSQIEAALHPEFVALLARGPHDPLYHAVATSLASTGPNQWPSESKAVSLLRWLRKPVQFQANERRGLLHQLPREEIDHLSRARIELLVPVRLDSRGTEAFLALGPKRSEEPYSTEDEDLLMAIADSIALLLERASAPPAREAFEECPTCGTCYDFGVGRCTRDGSVLALASSPRLLDGRYRVDRRVGRGGMGTVFAAFDTALERYVAAKLLREDLVLPGAAERFQIEARLGAALAHPNVVTVHDIGVTASGRPFFIMELLEGETLREELRRVGKLSPSRVLHIIRGICAAVDTAHRRQLIHRDLKPENVFLCHGELGDIPKVLDFGLAKALEVSGATALSSPGFVAGTPQYMAPEHVSGDQPSTDWDLWALGVMTFEMVTGHLPFAARSREPRGIDDLPAGLQQLFTRVLSMNPIDRPTSAQEFLTELEQELVCDELRS